MLILLWQLPPTHPPTRTAPLHCNINMAETLAMAAVLATHCAGAERPDANSSGSRCQRSHYRTWGRCICMRRPVWGETRSRDCQHAGTDSSPERDDASPKSRQRSVSNSTACKEPAGRRGKIFEFYAAQHRDACAPNIYWGKALDLAGGQII